MTQTLCGEHLLWPNKEITKALVMLCQLPPAHDGSHRTKHGLEWDLDAFNLEGSWLVMEMHSGDSPCPFKPEQATNQPES